MANVLEDTGRCSGKRICSNSGKKPVIMSEDRGRVEHTERREWASERVGGRLPPECGLDPYQPLYLLAFSHKSSRVFSQDYLGTCCLIEHNACILYFILIFILPFFLWLHRALVAALEIFVVSHRLFRCGARYQ